MDESADRDQKQSIELRVGGELLRLVVDATEAAQLKQAADYLNQKIQTFRQGSGSMTGQRIAILAGLDVAHERFQALAQVEQARSILDNQQSHLTNCLKRLVEKIDAAIPPS